MDAFNSLISTIERLLAPVGGCPWDREQTLFSMRHSLLEETYELIEAINLNDNQQIEEELGDLLFNAAFLGKLAEKEKRFTLEDALKHIVAKLIRRHPHVFGKADIKTSEEVLLEWEKIKQAEKKDKMPSSALDAIPKNFPSLLKAQKMATKLAKKPFVQEKPKKELTAEEQAGEALWDLIQQMIKQGIQPENALSKKLTQVELAFRDWEHTHHQEK